MATAFPADFPKPRVGGLSISPVQVMRKSVVQGVRSQQARIGPTNLKHVVSVHRATNAQLATLSNFWRNTLNRGSLPFTVDWLNGRWLTTQTDQVQYSANGTSWHTTKTDADVWYRLVYATGEYSVAERIGWENVCVFASVPTLTASQAEMPEQEITLEFTARLVRT